MLQQTQVARVVERFEDFVARFPSPRAMAESPEPEVLARWSGLGYYRRARLLHAAARAIVADHGGAVPRALDALRMLPGVGPYTAGSIASIVFDQPEPLVDGNVARVLLRLEGRSEAPDLPGVADRLWARAASLVGACDAADVRPAALNEGLMELGATICTPRRPRCPECPVRAACVARQSGTPERFPAPKSAPARRALSCEVVRLFDSRGRVLIEQRPDRGLWASMWQAPTLEHRARTPPLDLAQRLNLPGVALAATPGYQFTHALTHREVTFRVWSARAPRLGKFALHGRVWRGRADIATLALSSPQRRILLEEGEATPA